MDGEPRNLQFFYSPLGPQIFVLAVLALAALNVVAATILSVWYYFSHHGASFLFVLFAIWFLFFCGLLGYVAFYFFERARPVGINESIILNLWPSGRIWRAIDWANVQKIEQQRVYSSLFSRYETNYTIFGQRCRLRFQSAVLGLPQLIDAVNDKIRAHNIRVIFIDRGIDTLRHAARTLPPSSKRTDVLRNGVAREVPELTN